MKPIDFATFKKIQKMSLNVFNRWMQDLCGTMYDEGRKQVTAECVAALTEDRLYEILFNADVTQEQADKIINQIIAEGVSYNGIETR